MNAPFCPAGVPRKIGAMPRNLGEALRRSAACRPSHPAMIFYGAEISYAALLAAFLQHRCGVRRGDWVLLDMQNSPHFVIGFHAIVLAGAVVLPVNPMNLAGELANLCADSSVRAALIGAELLDRFADLMPAPLQHAIVAAYADAIAEPPPFRLPPGAVPWAIALADSRPPLPNACGNDDVCVMPFTSGITGKPKACVRTHAGGLFTAIAQAEWHRFDDATVVTGFMPLFHVAAMQVSMNGGIVAGATVVLMARWDRDLFAPLFTLPTASLSGVPRQPCWWTCSPHPASMNVPSPACASWDQRAGGAAPPLGPALRRGLRIERDDRRDASQSAGSAEAAMPGHPDPRHDGAHHRPGNAAWAAAGRDREIIIARPQVLRGYRNRPEADAEAFIDRDGLRLPAHRRSGADGRRRLFLHRRSAEADDQRQRLQGLARRMRGDALSPSRRAGMLRHRGTRRPIPIAARRSRRSWCYVRARR